MARHIDVFEVNDHSEQPIQIRYQRVPPLDQLRIGESIRFPMRQRHSVQTIASKLKREVGMIFTVKKEDTSWCRVWRIS